TPWPWLWPESRRASTPPAGRAGRPTPNARSKPAPELGRRAGSAAVGDLVAAVVVGRQRAGRLEVAFEPLRHGLERIGIRIVGGHRGRGRGAAQDRKSTRLNSS